MVAVAQDISSQLFKNRQAFIRFNQSKLNRIHQTLLGDNRYIFSVIPRLLHVNQEGLPGYINDKVPRGIHNYVIDHETQNAAEELFPHALTHRDENHNPFIQTVLLMGSVGSIAQTSSSDLDYTLFINKSTVTEEELALFNTKLKMIEEWTWEEHKLETHFFINDIEEVKQNIFGESDSESTGSAQAKLLKEEMYRTAVIVAGKLPLWFIFPVETDDKQYEAILNRIQNQKTILNRDDYIDIGNVDDISRGEFFGGSIWTLIKSFKSPFKTLMKMGLLEEYMFNPTKSNFLCHEVKRKIFDEVLHQSIDPYINLFERVEKYFKEHKTENEIDALRISFYRKAGTEITVQDVREGTLDSKKSILVKMIKSWNWSSSKLEQINNYKNWQMMQKVELGDRVNKILINSYKHISEKNSSLDASESLISEIDTHLLGRKLFSFYRKTNNKVENLFALVDGETAEKELTFLMHQEEPKDEVTWYIIRGRTLHYIEQIQKENIIRQAPNLEFLISFACFNTIYKPGTELLYRAEQQSINNNDLQKLLDQIYDFLARVDIANISNEILLMDAWINQLFMIVDFGPSVPKEVLEGDVEKCKTDEEYIAFMKRKLERMKTVTAVYLTSWGELFCHTFSGPGCLSRCMKKLGPDINRYFQDDLNFLKVYIPGSRRETLGFPWLDDYILKVLDKRGMSLFKGMNV